MSTLSKTVKYLAVTVRKWVGTPDPPIEHTDPPAGGGSGGSNNGSQGGSGVIPPVIVFPPVYNPLNPWNTTY